MYATPGASMYMPAGTTTIAAAPVVETVAAPTVVTQTPSYVAAPQTVEVAATPAMPQFGMPVPAKLTTGLVTPDVLEKERIAWNKALDAQLKKQTDAVNEEAKIKKKMVDQQAKTQLASMQLQIEEQVKMACLQVDQEAQQMCAALQEAAITQQTGRDEQTAVQVADYTKKKAIEDMNFKSWEFQKVWYEKEMKMVQEYEKVRAKGARAVQTPGLQAAVQGLQVVG